MKIKSITFRNIFCFGNKTTTVDYENMGNGSMNMVIGKNGCGKSSFIKLHKLALYFEAEGINTDGVSNDINGDGYLAIEVYSNKHLWNIESEYTKSKLNSINVFKDGSKIAEDWGKIPETKKMINQQIIDIPYHIFSNILSLSINDFKSFLSMNPKDTRNIRDRMFGFFILNEMNEVLKKNLKSFMANKDEKALKIQSIDEIIKETENKIFLEKEKQENESKESKESLVEKIKVISEEINTNNLFIQDCNHNLELLGLKTKKIENEKLLSLIESLEKQLSKISLEEENDTKTYSELTSLLNSLKKDKETYSSKKQLETYKLAVKKVEEFTKDYTVKMRSLQKMQEKCNEDSLELENLLCKQSFNEAINGIEGILVDVSVIYASYDSNVESLSSSLKLIENYTKVKDSNNKISLEIEKENKDLIKENKLYEEKKCPTCGNDFESEEFLRKIEENKAKIEENLEKIKNHTKLINVADESLIKEKEKYDTFYNNISSDSTSLKGKIKLLDDVSKTINTTNYKSIGNDTVTDFNRFLTDLVNDIRTKEENEKLEIIIKGIEENKKFLITDYDFTSEEVKKELQEKISNIETKKNEILNESETVKNIKSNINSYDSIVKSHDKEKIKLIESLCYEIEEINDSIIQSVEQNINDKSKNSSELNLAITNLKIKKGQIEESIKFQRSLILPDETFKKLEESQIAISIEADNIPIRMEEIKVLIDDTNIKNNANNEKINSYRADLQSLDEVNKSNLEKLNEYYEEYKGKLAILNDEERKISVNINFLRMIEFALSDAGIKSFIIKRLVPSINKNINEILSRLEIPLVVKFDDEFKPSIYRYAKSVSIGSISTGQTKMIDASIIFTITKTLLAKCNGINIVFYDEIFSSLHVSAVTTMMEIIHSELVEKMGLHVFLVNHSFVSNSFFDNIFEFSMKDHFSNVNIQSVEEYNEKLI